MANSLTGAKLEFRKEEGEGGGVMENATGGESQNKSKKKIKLQIQDSPILKHNKHKRNRILVYHS